MNPWIIIIIKFCMDDFSYHFNIYMKKIRNIFIFVNMSAGPLAKILLRHCGQNL